MAPNGKTARGLRGFPTPNDIPADDGGYVVFRIPRDNEWAGLLLGAASLLAEGYNFYQWGDLTPDEAAERWKVIVNQAPYEACGCEMPGGRRVLRLNSAGHIEQLTDGEWTPPTDDYTVPPVPARTQPTPDERRCLAAANAANVLQILYEEVTDAVAEGADEAEALAVFIATAVIIIGGWLGLALAALVELAFALFTAFLEIVEFMTADLWTSDFTDALRCMLYNCSSDDGGVVTFDFQCVREEMASYTDLLDTNFVTNLRLFGQVDFMLNVIGVDGLNAAGATTAITSATCECGNAYRWDFTVSPADWFVVADRGSGCCFGGLGFVSVYNYGGLGNTEIRIASPTQPGKTLTRYIVEYSAESVPDQTALALAQPGGGYTFDADSGIVTADMVGTAVIEDGYWRLDIYAEGVDAPQAIKSLTIFVVDNDFSGLTGGTVVNV